MKYKVGDKVRLNGDFKMRDSVCHISSMTDYYRKDPNAMYIIENVDNAEGIPIYRLKNTMCSWRGYWLEPFKVIYLGGE